MKRDVRLRVDTRLPQRLIQRAAAEGICISEARICDDDALTVCLSPSDARAFRALCGRFDLSVATVGLRGVGAAAAFLRRRATLAAAALTFALVASLMLGRLWRVDVQFTGSAAALGDAAAILEILDGLGVRPGVRVPVDTGALQDALGARLPGCSFIGVRRQGVRLLVTAAPEAPAPEVYALDDARDLCARLAGIVVSVNARAGTPCVAPGDVVRRGQLLIRGEEKDRDGAMRPIAALGEVVVRAWFTGEASLPALTKRLRPTGRASEAVRLSVARWDISLREGQSFPRQAVETRRLTIGGLYLPVALVRETRRELRAETEAVDAELLRPRLGALAMADAAARMNEDYAGDGSVARQWLEYENAGGTCIARAVIEITTDTAVTREALYLGG